MEALMALLILTCCLVQVSVVAFSSSFSQPYSKVSPSYQTNYNTVRLQRKTSLLLSSSSYQTNNIVRLQRKTSLILSSSTTTATDETIVPKTSSSNTLGVTVGYTKGATLLLDDVVIYTNGGDQILKSVNLRVEPNERWGIFGPNGCGKSTLLEAITGSQRIDDGKALVASKVKVGYLKQTAVSGSIKTVREEASSEMEEINNAKLRMDKLEEQISNGDSSEKVLNDLAKAQSRYEDIGGWTQDQDVDQVLKGLGFLPTDSERSVADFRKVRVCTSLSLNACAHMKSKRFCHFR